MVPNDLHPQESRIPALTNHSREDEDPLFRGLWGCFFPPFICYCSWNNVLKSNDNFSKAVFSKKLLWSLVVCDPLATVPGIEEKKAQLERDLEGLYYLDKERSVLCLQRGRRDWWYIQAANKGQEIQHTNSFSLKKEVSCRVHRTQDTCAPATQPLHTYSVPAGKDLLQSQGSTTESLHTKHQPADPSGLSQFLLHPSDGRFGISAFAALQWLCGLWSIKMCCPRSTTWKAACGKEPDKYGSCISTPCKGRPRTHW